MNLPFLLLTPCKALGYFNNVKCKSLSLYVYKNWLTTSVDSNTAVYEFNTYRYFTCQALYVCEVGSSCEQLPDKVHLSYS